MAARPQSLTGDEIASDAIAETNRVLAGAQSQQDDSAYLDVLSERKKVSGTRGSKNEYQRDSRSRPSCDAQQQLTDHIAIVLVVVHEAQRAED